MPSKTKQSKSTDKSTTQPKIVYNQPLTQRSRLTIIIFVVLFAAVGYYIYQNSRAAAGPPEIKSGLAGNWCLNDQSNDYTAKNPVNTAHCDGRDAEFWRVSGTGTNLLIQFSKDHSRCLAPLDGSVQPHSPVVIDLCNQHASQYWTRLNNGYMNSNALTATGNQICLAVPGGETGVQIRTETCNTNDTQNWKPQHFVDPNIAITKDLCKKLNYSGRRCYAISVAVKRIADHHHNWDNNRQRVCLVKLWTQESGWDRYATNPSSGAYGIPQALPPSKMGADANPPKSLPVAQIKWGLGYIHDRYDTPCGAWQHEIDHGWYVIYIPASGGPEQHA